MRYMLAALLAVSAGAADYGKAMADLYELRTIAMTEEALALLREPYVTAVEVFIRAAERAAASDTAEGDEAILAMGDINAALRVCNKPGDADAPIVETTVRWAVKCADNLTIVYSDLNRLFRLTDDERRMIERSSRKIGDMLAAMREVAFRRTVAGEGATEGTNRRQDDAR